MLKQVLVTTRLCMVNVFYVRKLMSSVKTNNKNKEQRIFPGRTESYGIQS